MFTQKKQILPLIIFAGLFIISGCVGKPPTPTVTPIPPTVTPLPPTPTSLPLAIKVNDGGIFISDYEEEMKRYDAAIALLGKTTTPEASKANVVEDLTGSELLYQAAIKGGFKLTDTDLQAHLAQLVQSTGGEAGFNTWLQNNGYSLDSFKRKLTRDLGAAWERDEIIKAIPATAEQIHARQIFFSREESAVAFRQKVDNGSDFAAMAAEVDPVTKGDLGWFPRGYLLQPEVEDAVFQLQVGQVSQVIKSSIGFHLVQVIERDPARALDADEIKAVETRAISDWVSKAKTEAKIEILVP
jgi:parvulin-like peptidyl-prolyl isomerase